MNSLEDRYHHDGLQHAAVQYRYLHCKYASGGCMQRFVPKSLFIVLKKYHYNLLKYLLHCWTPIAEGTYICIAFGHGIFLTQARDYIEKNFAGEKIILKLVNNDEFRVSDPYMTPLLLVASCWS